MTDRMLLESLISKYGKNNIVNTINEISSNIYRDAHILALNKNRKFQAEKFRKGKINALINEYDLVNMPLASKKFYFTFGCICTNSGSDIFAYYLTEHEKIAIIPFPMAYKKLSEPEIVGIISTLLQDQNFELPRNSKFYYHEDVNNLFMNMDNRWSRQEARIIANEIKNNISTFCDVEDKYLDWHYFAEL